MIKVNKNGKAVYFRILNDRMVKIIIFIFKVPVAGSVVVAEEPATLRTRARR